ncbi:MAG: ribonuclease P protein component [Desulfuromonadaceae bacterium]|nr:ribonuclease P protein component [Desulfuromonadaceae bacterium]
MKSRKLGKEKLVRKSYEYKLVFDSGERKKFAYFSVVLLAKKEGPTRLGLVVSRKVGGAFLRNKYKRFIREYFRNHYGFFSSEKHYDYVFILKKEFKIDDIVKNELFKLISYVQGDHSFDKIL